MQSYKSGDVIISLFVESPIKKYIVSDQLKQATIICYIWNGILLMMIVIVVGFINHDPAAIRLDYLDVIARSLTGSPEHNELVCTNSIIFMCEHHRLR